MSLFPRLLLATVAGLFGVMMIATAPPTEKAIFFYAFGAFCLAITVACVARGRTAQFFGSLVGFGVILAGAWYSVSTFFDGALVSDRRSQPSFLNSLFFLAVFGVPSVLYIWHARFGFGSRRPGSHHPGEQNLPKQDEP